MKRYEYCSVQYDMDAAGFGYYTISKPASRERYTGFNLQIIVADLAKEGWKLVEERFVGWFKAYIFMREIPSLDDCYYDEEP